MRVKDVEALEDELREIARRCDCELLQLRSGGGVLRLVLDRPDGVTLEHCERVSRDVSAYLDVADFDPGPYTLEVSSPGLDRELLGVRDFERFVGETVKITWEDPSTEKKRTDIARLTGCRVENGTARAIVELEIGKARHKLPLAKVFKARLEPQL